MKYYVPVIFCVIAILVLKLISQKYIGNVPSNVFLLIGIISSRENFEARQSIRDTWIQMLNKNDDKYLFLVGNDFCNIPENDRLSTTSCESWDVTLPAGVTENTVIESSGTCDVENLVLPSDLLIEIHHSIIIRRLCVLSTIVKHLLQLSLVDLASDDHVLTATFTSDASNKENTLICKTVEFFQFPKHYEAKLIFKDKPQLEMLKCNLKIVDKSQIISYRSSNKVHNISEFCVPISIVYTISDVNALQEHNSGKIERQNIWITKQKSIDLKLEEESAKFNDILLLNVVDVYRNLPLKLINFLKWSDKNIKFKYILKTDDDTFINIILVRNKLITVGVKRQQWWWSSFREHWPVQRNGKWREYSYELATYPPFPCGAGYVMTPDLVHYLTSNAAQLEFYQGEDVSIGIWLAPREPVFENSCWECTSCVQTACNVPQLTVEEMYKTWQSYLKYKNMCFNAENQS